MGLIQLRFARCPEDLDVKEFEQALWKRTNDYMEDQEDSYDGYKVFRVSLEEFDTLWKEQESYNEAAKDKCREVCKNGRLFAVEIDW